MRYEWSRSGFQLLETFYQRLGRVGQHQAGPVPQCIIQDAYDVLVDERLAAGKRKLLDAEA